MLDSVSGRMKTRTKVRLSATHNKLKDDSDMKFSANGVCGVSCGKSGLRLSCEGRRCIGTSECLEVLFFWGGGGCYD